LPAFGTGPAAFPFAADSSEPDRPQAVKASAVAPPLRGFGLDGLTPPRFGLSKQTKADWGRTALPTRTAMPAPTMCLATAATTPAPWTAKALESRVLTGLPERMMTPWCQTPPRPCAPIRRKPIGLTASAEAHWNPPATSLPKPRKPFAEIVLVIEQRGWHRALSNRLTELEAKQDRLTAH
jgi:hypothetical protein